MVMTAVKGCGQSDQSPGEVGSQGASLNRRHDLGLKHLCKDLGKSVAGRRKTTGVSQDIWAPPPHFWLMCGICQFLWCNYSIMASRKLPTIRWYFLRSWYFSWFGASSRCQGQMAVSKSCSLEMVLKNLPTWKQWMQVHDTVQKAVIKTIPKKRKCKKGKMVVCGGLTNSWGKKRS